MRLRRLRKNELLRDLVAENRLSIDNLIMPYFVIEGKNKREKINSMPDIFRLSVDNLLKEIAEIKKLGIKAILLFGIPKKKDKFATEAYKENGIIQKAIRKIKENFDVIVFSDVCICAYTTHGHCGIIKRLMARSKKFIVDNDKTLKILKKIALSYAYAGADFVAPSSMMDEQVKMIRETLDENGFQDVGILAYSAKYASNFYGPFREALDSFPKFGDRKSYQMDFRNANEAVREIKEDIKEGADIVMVKPALAYLDIIRKIKEKLNLPLAAYNVSGEYALVKFGAQKGLFEEKQMTLEILTAIKRAGADLIISYHAKELARWLKD